ncbi:CoA transferase [Gordonia sp. TBRC 11910]|uniref:CoA transferase n=1 Tax=Gordonia asplenii TaxID=2725283 RepID=A0A848KZ04_9ACTN|nr:CaiB/BaiF CoA-transferase family protein [Gordonia asplenii]NMO03619.1 CoA transferase [Gordonia asplenii]
MTGPLHGLRVVELAAIGPVPHAAMILAGLGADVVHVARKQGGGLDLSGGKPDFLFRNRRTIITDLRDPDDHAVILDLVQTADVLLEGMRPGTAERLGLGPDDCAAVNPRLIYGRMTGWGQTGELAPLAGHDLNYISMTGVLDAIGRPGEKPTVPLNMIGDFGGGSMFLIAGVLAALFERERSGLGQVVDAAMVDGASALAQALWALRGYGAWKPRRGSNLIDGGTPYYDTYECADGGYVAVGSIEPPFYAALLRGLELDPQTIPDRSDEAMWPALRDLFTETFRRRTRDEWAVVFAGTDACVTPVLTLDEVAGDSYLRARGTVIDVGGVPQAAPAPRFSRTPTDVPSPPSPHDQRAAVLRDWVRTSAGRPSDSAPRP